MVKLVVKDLAQITLLEQALVENNIEYTTQLSNGEYGIETPHLIVYGVPLDEIRSFSWIKERVENE